MAKLMALDVGTKRVGVAVSDENRRFAVPSDIVDASNWTTYVVDRLQGDNFDTIVLGLPLDLRGREGPAAKRSRDFGAKLERILDEAGLDLQIVYIDERMTSILAHHMLNETGMRGRKQREQVDAIAAQQILQAYLDSISVESHDD